MSLMDKQKAKIIRSVFITGGHFDSANEDMKEYFQKQFNLLTKYKKIQIFGANQGSVGTYSIGVGNLTSTVLEALKDKVREDRRNLDEARKTAKRRFDAYMSFKKIMNYSNNKNRKNFNRLKCFYKDSAINVQIRKSQLKQDEILLNKFSEYLTLTKFD
jgi:hypothetical protein